MGPDVVILMDPLCYHTLGFGQCVKDFLVQPFLSTCAVEAFLVAVFPGTARMDIDGFNLDGTQSFVQYTGLARTFVITA